MRVFEGIEDTEENYWENLSAWIAFWLPSTNINFNQCKLQMQFLSSNHFYHDKISASLDKKFLKKNL